MGGGTSLLPRRQGRGVEHAERELLDGVVDDAQPVRRRRLYGRQIRQTGKADILGRQIRQTYQADM